MSFEYITEDGSKTVNINKSTENAIAKSIVKDYTAYNDGRVSSLNKANAVIDEVFFKNKYNNVKDKNERWKSKIKMCKCYMFYQTLKAFI